MTTNQLAFSTNAYTRHSLIDALRGIRRAGFAGVEILADAPHAYPDAMDDEQVREVRRELDKLGLKVSNINANCTFGFWTDAPPEPYFEPSLISPNPHHRAERTRMLLKTLEIGHELGARNVSITSGRLLPGMPPEKATRQLDESIRPILNRADALGIDIGIECEPGLFLEYAEELRAWIDRLGHPRLGANLDIGHSQVIGESIPEVVKLLRGRIWNLHVEDIPGRKHYHLIPGEGTLDWPAVWEALRFTGYQRFATVELYTCVDDPQSAAEKSFQFLQQFM
jgi:fructoselysine 3-epimerase